jgi:hypothetical protein
MEFLPGDNNLYAAFTSINFITNFEDPSGLG